MKYNELIDCCISTIKSWNPIVETLDSHADNALKKIDDPNEKVFIKQVLYGTHRYEQLLKVFFNALFKVNPGSTNRNDTTLYSIFIYLIIFRLDELPFDEFKKMVLCQDAVKMNALFQFLFDINMLKTHVREDWSKIYDPTYVDNALIGVVENRIPLMADLLATVSKKATGKVSDLITSLGSDLVDDNASKNQFQPTKPEPFNLSKPKVKALPQPIIIPKVVKANPIPEKIFKTNVKEIEDEKKKRREDIKENLKKSYENSKQQKFDLQSEKRPTNIDKIKKETEDKIKAETKIIKYYKPPRKFDSVKVEPKLTVAAILKEDAVLKKQQEEVEKYISNVEMNMRDSSEFENWKAEQEEIIKQKEIEYKERKRVEMQLAREAAMKAVEEKTKKNEELVHQIKEMSKEHQKEIEEKLQAEIENKKILIQGVVEMKINVEIEKKKLKENKKKIHDDVENQKKELMNKKKEEDLVQKKKREELIAKIRELEKIPIQRTNTFDPAETMGFGLLEEMSLVELRERLETQKRLIAEEAERKRLENLKNKEHKNQELNEKLEKIKASRAEREQNYQAKKSERIKALEDEKMRQQELKEKSLLEVHSKIMKKKQDKANELDRIAEELREINLKRQYMNADKAMVEEKAWKGLQDGAEREIKDRQNQKLIDQEKIERINLDERKLIAGRAKSQVESRIEANKEYDEKVAQCEKELEIFYREERGNLIKKHEKAKQFKQAHIENMEKRDPYKTKITTANLTNAKSKSMAASDLAKGKNSQDDFNNLPGAKYTNGNVIKEDVKGETLE